MLEPMKLHKKPKGQCQNEPWDLNVCHLDPSADVLEEPVSMDNFDMPVEQAPLPDERPVTPIPEPGENVEIGSFDETAVPVNKCKETDGLCYSVSEVKLYRLTKSELEKYLGKVTGENTTSTCSKGDNVDIVTDTDAKNSPPCLAYSRMSRPLRQAATKSTYADSDDADNGASIAVPKVGNRAHHSKPSSKPSSSRPSASRIAA